MLNYYYYYYECMCRTISWNNGIPSRNKPTRQKTTSSDILLSWLTTVTYFSSCACLMTRGKVTTPLGGYPGCIIHTSPGRVRVTSTQCIVPNFLYIALVNNFIGRPTVFKLFFSSFLHDCQYSSFGEFLRNESVHKNLVKVLLNRSHMSGHTIRIHAQTHKLELLISNNK